jgi:DNA-binding NtrC family response regulator
MAEEDRHAKSPSPDSTPTVLVVDDDATMRDVLEMRLQEWGFHVLLAADAREASELVRRKNPDLVLSDVVMPEMSGLELLRELKQDDVDRPVLLLTAHGTVKMAVAAIKEGAVDFLTKPLSYPNLRAVLEQALRDRALVAQSPRAAAGVAEDQGFGPFIGTSPQMKEVYGLIRDLAASDASVLITGESGTGKELAAQTIHERSARGDGPFVALNAAAIPRELVESELFGHERGAFTGASTDRMGCFELAAGGTLLLDEIAEMPMELQPKLLRVLDQARFRRVGGKQEIAVDVRTISATNRDPREAVQNGDLREDLYYRLNVFTLSLPALREREGDIALMAEHFLDLFGRKHGSTVRGIRDETLELMGQYGWPGNVRELRNVMERAVVMARNEWMEPSQLPPYIRGGAEGDTDRSSLPSGLTAAEVEKRLILQTLDETGNNKAETARRLGLDVKTIRNKLKSYGIER